jgi:hypothetical protein
MASGQTSATSSIATQIRMATATGEESMDKQKAVQKANELKQELEGLFEGEFRTLCNCGYAGSFDIRRYGTPTVYIGGSIFSDNYYVTVWDKTGKHTLYDSGFKQLTKAEMINKLGTVIKQKNQLSLF